MNGRAEGLTLWTVGHSTRSLEELVGLLHGNQIEVLADVRTIPRSRRNPQFNKDFLELERGLPDIGIGYRHLPGLGGLRKGSGTASINTGWRTPGFRNYADYMQGADFAEALEELVLLAKVKRVAIMCAEALWWRCHRTLIADALTVRGVAVIHILGPGKTEPHRLTTFARIEDDGLTYPPPKENEHEEDQGLHCDFF